MSLHKRLFKISRISACLLLVAVFDTFCQENQEDSVQVAAASVEKLKFTPILAPSYSPETELMINLGGLLTFKLKPKDPILQRSSIPFSIGYSTNKSLSVNFRPYIHGNGDKSRLFGDIWIKNMPDNYWGIGYQEGHRVSDPDSTTQYQREWWQVNLSTVFLMSSHLYAGINLDLNQTRPSELNEYMKADPIIQEYGTQIRNSGIGAIILYDTRDVPVNAYSGLYINITSTFYGRFLNGENNYGIYLLDYRQYKSIRREGRTLAWQVKSRFGNGNVPWPEMSQLGTPFDLRGYRWGRYRDRNMVLGLLEYRHMFMRKTPNKKGKLMSRSGLVTWIGTGSVASRIGSFKNWLPNVGIGYRFEIQSRMNARIDFGFGEDTSSFYVSFNEAF